MASQGMRRIYFLLAVVIPSEVRRSRTQSRDLAFFASKLTIASEFSRRPSHHALLKLPKLLFQFPLLPRPPIRIEEFLASRGFPTPRARCDGLQRFHTRPQTEAWQEAVLQTLPR